jgi:3D (Asp-Asp-Asp) domain-containing protein
MANFSKKINRIISKPLTGGERFLASFVVIAFVVNMVYPRAAFGKEVIRWGEPILKAAPPVLVVYAGLPKGLNKPRYQVKKTIKVLATAYSSTPDQTDSTPFITANGKVVHDGLVAANFLPFGTKLRLPEVYGDKVFTVNDRMHPRFSNRLDVWMKSREEARRFGAKTVKVEILTASK